MYSRAPLLGVVLALVSLSPTLASAGIERGDLRISAGLAAVSYKATDIESEDFKTTTVEIASGALFQFGKITANSVEFGLKLGLFFENIERPAKDASVDLGLFFTYESGTADAGGFRNDLDVEGFTIGPRVKISIWP